MLNQSEEVCCRSKPKVNRTVKQTHPIFLEKAQAEHVCGHVLTHTHLLTHTHIHTCTHAYAHAQAYAHTQTPFSNAKSTGQEADE